MPPISGMPTATLNLDALAPCLTGSLPNWGKQYAFPALRDLYLDNNTFTGK